jgi:hypothetical protein
MTARAVRVLVALIVACAMAGCHRDTTTWTAKAICYR